MKTIYIKNNEFNKLPDEICAAIGNFDGVHLGHQELVKECKKHSYKSGIITFYPHPSVFLKKIPNYPLLTPIDEKTKVFSNMGIDYLIIIEFNNEMAIMSKDEFINHLKELNIKSLVAGYDFTFGKMAEGDIRDLNSNFEFYEVKKYIYDGVRVSTTYIRELLDSGNVKEASKLLGRDYSISGKVEYGNQKGRLIGFPTANVDYKNYFLPKGGVYSVTIEVNDKEYNGICNIGNNPTINYSLVTKLEVHIIDFNDNIYGKDIRINFKDRIRDEMKFTSADELINQLKKDKCYALDR
jgi:riboflavin kinase/FMN adenylyltransferase